MTARSRHRAFQSEDDARDIGRSYFSERGRFARQGDSKVRHDYLRLAFLCAIYGVTRTAPS